MPRGLFAFQERSMNHTVTGDHPVERVASRDLTSLAAPASAKSRSVLTKDELADLAHNVAAEIIEKLGLRIRPGAQEDSIIVTGPLIIDLGGYEAVVGGDPVKLQPREFSLLAALARNLGQVLTRDQLLDLAWPNPERVHSNRAVDVSVRRLRRKLGNAANLIRTVGCAGYKLVKAAVIRSPNDS